MNELKCSHTECPAVFKTDEPLSPDAKYTCRHHTKKAPNNLRLQKYAHDRALGKVSGISKEINDM